MRGGGATLRDLKRCIQTVEYNSTKNLYWGVCVLCLCFFYIYIFSYIQNLKIRFFFKGKKRRKNVCPLSTLFFFCCFSFFWKLIKCGGQGEILVWDKKERGRRRGGNSLGYKFFFSFKEKIFFNKVLYRSCVFKHKIMVSGFFFSFFSEQPQGNKFLFTEGGDW